MPGINGHISRRNLVPNTWNVQPIAEWRSRLRAIPVQQQQHQPEVEF